MKRTIPIALAVIAAACAPALREPPSVADLASRTAPPATDDAATLLKQADALWAKRPDVAAVREAQTLYFQAAQADESDVLGLIGAVRAKAWLADHESDPRVREALAVSCVQTAQWCGRRQADNPACDYWLAVAVGLQAREVRSTADDGVKTMVASLQRAIDKDPSYDAAGPHRIMAIVLMRAPGWPLGPGDPELALDHARKAVALRPDYPPNLIALGEAAGANKLRDEARAAYERAKAGAQALRDAGEPDASDWMAEAEQALAKLKA